METLSPVLSLALLISSIILFCGLTLAALIVLLDNYTTENVVLRFFLMYTAVILLGVLGLVI